MSRMNENLHEMEFITLQGYVHDLQKTIDTLQKHPEDGARMLGLRPDMAGEAPLIEISRSELARALGRLGELRPLCAAIVQALEEASQPHGPVAPRLVEMYGACLEDLAGAMQKLEEIQNSPKWKGYLQDTVAFLVSPSGQAAEAKARAGKEAFKPQVEPPRDLQWRLKHQECERTVAFFEERHPAVVDAYRSARLTRLH